MTSKGESEIVVMRDIYRKLALLNPTEQQRVLEWVIRRLNEDNGKPFNALTALPPNNPQTGRVPPRSQHI